MPYICDVPRRNINLNISESVRWYTTINCDFRAVATLIKATKETMWNITRKILGKYVKHYYVRYGGLYQEEMRAWAAALGIAYEDVLLANCSYELSHIIPGLGIFGCTAGIVNTTKGPVHVRNMDWPLCGIGQATRLFKFHNQQHKFYSVGIAGFVGVLSGMVPKAYSVTINWAPADGLPTFDFSPTMLLRHTLETCDTYSAAVQILKNTPIATPVLYVVCGAKQDEACVIERTKTASGVRKMEGHPLVQANHFVSPKFEKLNVDEELVEDSTGRMECLESALANRRRGLITSLDTEPVFNGDTQQQMLFCPATGAIQVYRYVSRL